MKFFQCMNDECVANRPGTAEEYKINAELMMIFPLESDGEIDYEADGRLGDITYACGICGDNVEEVAADQLMEARIQKASSGEIYGQFRSSVREKKVYNFYCNLKQDKAISKEIDLWDFEKLFLLDFCQEQYAENAIKIEILDKVGKVYSLQLRNLDDGVVLSIEATEDEILEISGRGLNPVEKERVHDAIRESSF